MTISGTMSDSLGPTTDTFKYDPFGRRINKSSSSGTSIYAYDGDNLIEETNSSGAVVARYEDTQNIEDKACATRMCVTRETPAGPGATHSLKKENGPLLDGNGPRKLQFVELMAAVRRRTAAMGAAAAATAVGASTTASARAATAAGASTTASGPTTSVVASTTTSARGTTAAIRTTAIGPARRGVAGRRRVGAWRGV